MRYYARSTSYCCYGNIGASAIPEAFETLLLKLGREIARRSKRDYGQLTMEIACIKLLVSHVDQHVQILNK